jgi:hypothetical protein
MICAILIYLALASACPAEDSANCYWNAAQQGNGQGRSFIDLGGRAFFLP